MPDKYDSPVVTDIPAGSPTLAPGWTPRMLRALNFLESELERRLSGANSPEEKERIVRRHEARTERMFGRDKLASLDEHNARITEQVAQDLYWKDRRGEPLTVNERRFLAHSRGELNTVEALPSTPGVAGPHVDTFPPAWTGRATGLPGSAQSVRQDAARQMLKTAPAPPVPSSVVRRPPPGPEGSKYPETVDELAARLDKTRPGQSYVQMTTADEKATNRRMAEIELSELLFGTSGPAKKKLERAQQLRRAAAAMSVGLPDEAGRPTAPSSRGR